MIPHYGILAFLVASFCAPAVSAGDDKAPVMTKVFDKRGFYCVVDKNARCVWNKKEIKWSLNRSPAYLTQTNVISAMKNAANTWSSATDFTLTYVPLKDGADVLVDWALGGKNDPMWQDTWARAQIPGFCGLVDYPCDPRLIIFMTEELNNDPIKWSTADVGPKADELDVESVALHEWGHILGIFGHCGVLGNRACVPNQVMQNYKKGYKLRVLSTGDIDWVRDIYKANKKK